MGINQGISPSFYAIRWLTTLLSREFNLADTIRLWDSLWTDTDRHTFLSYLCCAMIIEMRDDIMKGDFSENLCLLQAYPQSSSCDSLIAVANQLRANDVLNDKMASIQKHEQESSPTTVADRMFHDMMNVVTAVRSGFSKVFEDEFQREGRGSIEHGTFVNEKGSHNSENKARVKKEDVINNALRDIGSEVVDGADRLHSLIAHYFTPTNNTKDIMDEDGIMYFDIDEEEDDEGVLVNRELVNSLVGDDNDSDENVGGDGGAGSNDDRIISIGYTSAATRPNMGGHKDGSDTTNENEESA